MKGAETAALRAPGDRHRPAATPSPSSPRRDGIYNVTAVVLSDSATESVARTYSIPLIAGAGLAGAACADGEPAPPATPPDPDQKREADHAAHEGRASYDFGWTGRHRLCQNRRNSARASTRRMRDRARRGTVSTSATTLMRVDAPFGGEDGPDLHPHLRTQLRELRLRSGSGASRHRRAAARSSARTTRPSTTSAAASCSRCGSWRTKRAPWRTKCARRAPSICRSSSITSRTWCSRWTRRASSAPSIPPASACSASARPKWSASASIC